MSEQRPVPNLMKALRESLEKAVQPPATPLDRVDVVAREIAKELMSNGFGDQGDRLAIRLGSQDFGGWSLDGAARQIRITLEQEGYVLDRMAEAARRAQLKVSAPPAVWQDIETAPKDGRYVWLYSPHFRKYFTAAGNILPGRWDATVGRWSVPHWGHIDVAPTHFQPLPSPPTPGETR